MWRDTGKLGLSTAGLKANSNSKYIYAIIYTWPRLGPLSISFTDIMLLRCMYIRSCSGLKILAADTVPRSHVASPR